MWLKLQVVVLSLVVACHKMWSEGQATADICYNHLNNIDDNNVKLRWELIELAKLAETFPPISAYGFFDINRQLILGFFGSIISYIIIIIQIKKQ